jgi:hypothetical protein
VVQSDVERLFAWVHPTLVETTDWLDDVKALVLVWLVVVVAVPGFRVKYPAAAITRAVQTTPTRSAVRFTIALCLNFGLKR